MKAPAGPLIGAIVVVLFAVNLVSFTVNEVEQVIVTQFGEPVRVIDLYDSILRCRIGAKDHAFRTLAFRLRFHTRTHIHQRQEDSHR